VMRYLKTRGVRRVLQSALPDGRTSPNQVPVVDLGLAFFAINLTNEREWGNSTGTATLNWVRDSIDVVPFSQVSCTRVSD
jgi:hypothetical protein